MELRLQKFLAGAGLASRRAAEKIILAGEIQVNGKVVRELGTKICPEKDSISYLGKRVHIKKSPKLLYAFCKPKNCITSLKDDKNRQTIADFLPKMTPPLFPIGRLDYHSEGLLLITNNGMWAEQIGHPRYKIKKVYLVKIDCILQEIHWKKLNQAMKIQGRIYRAKFKQIKKIENKSWLQAELYQGFNLQIKKMLQYVGAEVLKLKRIQIGNVYLTNLQAGELRFLCGTEIKNLLELGARSTK